MADRGKPSKRSIVQMARRSRSLSRSSGYSSRSRSRSNSRSISRSPGPGHGRSRSPSPRRQHSRSPRRDHSAEPVAVKKIAIERLTRNTLPEHIREIFSAYGTIISVNMPINPDTKTNKGFAHVEYEMPEMALKAVEHMDRGQLDGNVLWVELLTARRVPPAPLGRRPSYHSGGRSYGGYAPRRYSPAPYGRYSSRRYSPAPRSPYRRPVSPYRRRSPSPRSYGRPHNRSPSPYRRRSPSHRSPSRTPPRRYRSPARRY